MAELILLWPILSKVIAVAFAIVVYLTLKSIDDSAAETNRLLQSLIDLQRIALGRSDKPDEKAETGQGLGKGRGEIVHQIESYGDLSKVGMLKTPKT